MKKFIYAIALLMVVTFAGCGGDSPESVAKKWCAMQADIEKAEGDAKDKLQDAQRDYEKSVEAKHKDDKEYMKKVEELVEACD